jgi:hypothetical protein
MSTDLKKAAEELDGLVQAEDESMLSRIVKSLMTPGALLMKGGVAMPAETENKGAVGHEKTETGAKEPKPENVSDDKKGTPTKDIKADAGDGGKGEGGDESMPEVGGGDGGEGLERDADGNLIVSGKRKKVKTGETDVVPGDQKKDEAKVQGGDDAAHGAQRKSEGLPEGEYEIIDTDSLSAALNDLGTRMSKSEGGAAEIVALRAEFHNFAENVATVLGALAKSQGEIYKSMEQRPATLPSPGVVGVVRADGRNNTGQKSKATKGQVLSAIEKGMNESVIAVADGVKVMQILDSRGVDAAIAAIPSPEMVKSLGL